MTAGAEMKVAVHLKVAEDMKAGGTRVGVGTVALTMVAADITADATTTAHATTAALVSASIQRPAMDTQRRSAILQDSLMKAAIGIIMRVVLYSPHPATK
jgi:hypothetical protein